MAQALLGTPEEDVSTTQPHTATAALGGHMTEIHVFGLRIRIYTDDNHKDTVTVMVKNRHNQTWSIRISYLGTNCL